jgi:hypothetical protein
VQYVTAWCCKAPAIRISGMASPRRSVRNVSRQEFRDNADWTSRPSRSRHMVIAVVNGCKVRHRRSHGQCAVRESRPSDVIPSSVITRGGERSLNGALRFIRRLRGLTRRIPGWSSSNLLKWRTPWSETAGVQYHRTVRDTLPSGDSSQTRCDLAARRLARLPAFLLNVSATKMKGTVAAKYEVRYLTRLPRRNKRLSGEGSESSCPRVPTHAPAGKFGSAKRGDGTSVRAREKKGLRSTLVRSLTWLWPGSRVGSAADPPPSRKSSAESLNSLADAARCHLMAGTAAPPRICRLLTSLLNSH